jgi:hypothetical protein
MFRSACRGRGSTHGDNTLIRVIAERIQAHVLNLDIAAAFSARPICSSAQWRFLYYSTARVIRLALAARIDLCSPALLISETRFAGRNRVISSKKAFSVAAFVSSS